MAIIDYPLVCSTRSGQPDPGVVEQVFHVIDIGNRDETHNMHQQPDGKANGQKGADQVSLHVAVPVA